MDERIEALEAEVAFLKDQMSLLAQYLAIMIGRAQVNDCMLSALILSHPDRESLNRIWRQSSAIPRSSGSSTSTTSPIPRTAERTATHPADRPDGHAPGGSRASTDARRCPMMSRRGSPGAPGETRAARLAPGSPCAQRAGSAACR
jgi:hypothetical protein